MESFKVSLYWKTIYKDKEGTANKSYFLFKVFTKKTSDYKKFLPKTFFKICLLNVLLFMNSLISTEKESLEQKERKNEKFITEKAKQIKVLLRTEGTDTCLSTSNMLISIAILRGKALEFSTPFKTHQIEMKQQKAGREESF